MTEWPFRGSPVERPNVRGQATTALIGKREHRRVEAGKYPARTHKTSDYQTSDYTGRPGTRRSPRLGLAARRHQWAPATESSSTRPVATGSTIGCVNLGPEITGPNSRLTMRDSLKRVVAVIDDLKAFAGPRFPGPDSEAIPNAFVLIVDPPS